MLAGQGGGDQGGVGPAPGQVVSQGDRGLQDQGAVKITGREIIIHHLVAQQGRIGDGDDLVGRRADAHRQKVFLDDVADHIAHTDMVADAEGAGVDQDDTADQIGDRRCGAQREQQAKKNRNTLEGWRTETRHKGKSQHRRQGDHQGGQQVKGGLAPFGIKTGNRQAATVHRHKERPEGTQQGESQKQDDGNDEEIGQIIADRREHLLQGSVEITEAVLTDSPGPGKKAQSEGGEIKEAKQQQQQPQQRQHLQPGLGNRLGGDDLHLIQSNRRYAPGDQAPQQRKQPAREADHRKTENQEANAGDQRVKAMPQQSTGFAILAVLNQGRLDLLQGLLDQRLGRQAAGLGIAFIDGEQHILTGADIPEILIHRLLNGE